MPFIRELNGTKLKQVIFLESAHDVFFHDLRRHPLSCLFRYPMPRASQSQVRCEKLDLLLPHVQAGASGGNFGGGAGNNHRNEDERRDVDLMAVWELKNLGRGHAHAKKRRQVQLDQALLEGDWISDKITSEIVMAKADVDSYRRQIEVARSSVVTAGQSYSSNQIRIANAEGRPIELLQAIYARSEALDNYTKAVSNYNRAQFRLLRAIGRPPGGGPEQ